MYIDEKNGIIIDKFQIESFKITIDYDTDSLKYNKIFDNIAELRNIANLKDLEINFKEINFMNCSDSTENLIKLIKEVWMQDIKNNQKLNIFLKLPIVKNFYNVAVGFSDLIFLPIFYANDNFGLGVYSGVNSFCKNIGKESYKIMGVVVNTFNFSIKKTFGKNLIF